MDARLACLIVPALAVAACQTPLVCGEKTKEENGKCVAQFVSRCGEGTHAQGDDCVPDSNITCGAGTKEVDGRCVPAEVACGAGTEEVNRRCELIDPFKRVTVPEGAEPNLAPANMGRFAVPDIGAPAVVLGGRVSKPQGGQSDLDGFVFAARAHQRIHLQSLAIGVPAVGLLLQPADPDLAFGRFSLTLDSRSPGRDLVLPAAGDWYLIVSDIQNFLTDGLPVGSEEFTYTVDVTQVQPPAAKTLENGTAVQGQFTDLDVYAFTADDSMALLDVVLAPSPADNPFQGQRAVWATAADGSLLLNLVDDASLGFLIPIAPARLVAKPGVIKFVVDYVYVLDVGTGAPPPYDLTVSAVNVHAIDSGAPTSSEGALSGRADEVYSMDVPANAIVSATLELPSDSQISGRVELRDAAYKLVAGVNVASGAYAATLRTFVPAAGAGRYFLVVSDRNFQTSDTRLGFTLKTSVSPVTVVGPVAAGATESATGSVAPDASTWFAVYAGNDEKLEVTVEPDATVEAHAVAWPLTLGRQIGEASSGAPGGAAVLPQLLTQASSAILVEVTAPQAGQVAVRALGVDAAAFFESEPNNSSGQANSLVPDGAGHAEVAGFMPDSTDKDYFVVVVQGAGALAMTAETHAGVWGGKMDTIVEIQDATGSQLARNDDHGGSMLSLVTTPVAQGVYYLAVSRFSYSAGEYDGTDYILTVDVQ